MRMLAIIVLLAACTVQRPAFPPLVEAARGGDAAAVRALCLRGADPNAPAGGNGWTPLLHAVHTHQLRAAAALLDAGADVDRSGPEGTTPLMMAAGYGNREMVALLLARGADARARDLGGSTALDYALTGVSDVDAFTLFRCQNETVTLLGRVSPSPRAPSLRWAKMKGCVSSSSFSRSS